MTSATRAWSLAIDFGTSNSAAAHSGATSRSIEALSLTHTSNLMPSAVFVDPAGTVLVGGAALNSATQNPAGSSLHPNASSERNRRSPPMGTPCRSTPSSPP
ncbi:hypothetical protein [Gordonia sp. SMJS1]|uniref:hypothetical protein n=1 Tax=Gordonia sp. SMJS1 TaxID=3039400 RepID=UPI002456769F|nr:hypothetical protein [Gordonia sp. SMJS1]WGJ88141.1 hypothetical protein QAD21_23975 [Gordonia sp. SMJS1]